MKGIFTVYITFMITALAGLPAGAASYKAMEAFDKANEAYNATNYVQAIRLYKTAEELKFTPAALYYNLGNAFYRSGRLGKAIASYRRALRLDPRDPDITENLTIARSQTDDGITVPEIPAPVRSFLFVYYYIGFDELVWACGVLMVLLCLTAAVHLYFPWRGIKTLFFCILCILLITGTSAAAHWYFTRYRASAVVISDEGIVRAGPRESYAEIFILHDGAEMRVLQKENDWVKVQIQIENDVKRGWIQAQDIEII
jgi:tetratricopeptide (TPR) repeat protein